MVVNKFPMAYARAAIATNPRLFGRGQMRDLAIREEGSWSIPDDVKLFAWTFAAGFLFVSILIA